MTSFLLDTHVVLWLLGEPERVPDHIRSTLADRRHELFISAATGLEISTKIRIGTLESAELSVTLRHRVADIGAIELPISAEHAMVAGELTWAHRDPFDRILVAQALIDNLILVSIDRTIVAFGGVRVLTWDCGGRT